MKIRAGLGRLAVVAMCALAPGLAAIAFIPASAFADDQAAPATTPTAPAASKTTTTKPAQKVSAARKKTAPKAVVVSRPGGPTYESIVVDADTGQVLHEVDADIASPPASLTKMMTLYLLFDALERGEVRMTTPMRVSVHAASQSPSKLNIPHGKAITVDQAIDAIVTLSANDVAVVIAEQLGGTEEHFAEMMTDTAHKMGMKQSNFHNASGLPDPLQFSSARDMAILAKHLIQDHPDYYQLFSRLDFAYGGRTIHTHNHVLENYEGVDGIKTGYTVASGYNLVSSAKRDNHRIIAVVFGGASAQARDHHMMDLLDQGFAALTGQPGTLVAARRIEEFQKINLAAARLAPQDPTDSAGDREETYQPPASIAAIIQSSELPPLPPASDAVPMPAPKLATLPAQNPKPVPTLMADSDETAVASRTPATSVPPPGTWGIQIGAFGTEAAANAQANTAAEALRGEFSGATAVVQSTVVGGKKLFRAQVHGLARENLNRACALVTVQPKTACKALPPEGAKTAALPAQTTVR